VLRVAGESKSALSERQSETNIRASIAIALHK
jgi:uncharacterized protein (UPF0147 family)